MTDEQLRLIARILDGLCTANPIVRHIDELFGVNVGRCRYCGVTGHFVGTSQIKHEHPDECVLALNAQLQESLKEDN